MEKFYIGCCYYPEHFGDDEMYEDILKIKDLGFNIVRMGEFSWSMYEKEEGKYDFSFLKKAVDFLGKNGIDVILGTPTAAPPKWLIDKHPEVLCYTNEGFLLHHGSRQHHNHTSEVYLSYSEKIVEAMVLAFKDCKNVVGWQLDNEFNCHRSECYSDADDEAFRKWLKNKYGTIEKLNDCWGNRFWSLEFNNFEQIECPKKTTTSRNPSWVTDFYLFTADSVNNYASVQTKIIRKYMPDSFITHNGLFGKVDYKKLTDENLDFLSFDSYPAFHETAGVGKSRNHDYQLERTRGCSEKMMIMEQQSGPGGNIGGLGTTPLPGQIRLWTYQSIAHGAVGVLYFRYRTALYGAEQLWHGIFDHDKEENYRSREVRKVANELKKVGNIFLYNRQNNEVAIFHNYHNQAAQMAEPFACDNWSIYIDLMRRNIHSDIIYSFDNIEKYKVVIVPHMSIAPKEWVEKLTAYANNGGIVILSARSGCKDEYSRYLPEKIPGVFKNMTGCQVDWYTSINDHRPQTINMNGKNYKLAKYCEMLGVNEGEVVATYGEGYNQILLDGKPAITKNGNTYYVGFYCDACPEIYYELIKEYISEPEYINENVEIIRLGDYKMYLNFGNTAVPFKAKDIISGNEIEEIEPYGVILT